MKKFIGTFYRIISLNPYSSQASRSAGDRTALRAYEHLELGDAAPPKPDLSEEEFFVDYEMEEEAILREAGLIENKPEFNFLNINEQNASQYAYLFDGLGARGPDFRHLYSCKSNQQLVVVNMERILLADLETATVTQEMKRKDVAQVNILPNSVSVVSSQRTPNKHSEMIILDRKKFTDVADYFSLYWMNLVISPLSKRI